MGKKRSSLEGFGVLKIKEINECFGQVSLEQNPEKKISLDSFHKQHKQYITITVAIVDNKYYAVDNEYYFNYLKGSKIKNIQCFSLGSVTRSEYYGFRILLNTHNTRLNYTKIASMVSYMKSKGNTILSICNKVGMDHDSVNYFCKLLDFDWEDYILNDDTGQSNLF